SFSSMYRSCRRINSFAFSSFFCWSSMVSRCERNLSMIRPGVVMSSSTRHWTPAHPRTRSRPAAVGPPQPREFGPEAPQHLLLDYRQIILLVPVLLTPRSECRHELVPGDEGVDPSGLDLLGEEHPGRVDLELEIRHVLPHGLRYVEPTTAEQRR